MKDLEAVNQSNEDVKEDNQLGVDDVTNAENLVPSNINILRTNINQGNNQNENNDNPRGVIVPEIIPFPHFSTLAIHAGKYNDMSAHGNEASTSSELSINLATTFQQDAPGANCKFSYARCGNPSRNSTESCLAAIEGVRHCVLLSSGLAGVLTMCNTLQTGDHILCVEDVYGGSYRYFTKVASQLRIDSSFVDADDVGNFVQAIRPNTKMVWLESPTNPLLNVLDLELICKQVHEVNPSIKVVVDNTMQSPYFQRPLELGADVSFHSISKYINGHSDVIMGALLFNDDQLNDKLRFLQNSLGVVPSPFDCYLVSRGMKTLAIRMRKHMSNAFHVATYLQDHPKVFKVLYPGLPCHEQHELSKRQMRGYSGVVSFYLKGTSEHTNTFLSNLKVFKLAESLGGYESLANLPSLMTHASTPMDVKNRLGITDNLVRLSVGLENHADLTNDLKQAFESFTI